MNIRKFILSLCLLPLTVMAQINTDRVMAIARNALYFEDYVLSIQYFNQVIAAKPYLYEPYFYRALAKFNLDDYSGAEADCNRALERNPFVVGSYQVRGLARIRQQKYDEAVSDYQTALKYDPENTVLWHNLSLCHLLQKKYDDAESDLDNLIRISPRYATAYLMRGEVFLNKKDTVQALADFDKAIEIERYEPGGWSAKGIVLLQQGKYKEAEQNFDQAIQLSVRNAGNYINRALARFNQNNLRGAMSDYDMALDVDPNNFLGHYNRGLLRARVGDDNRAIEDFDFVLNIDPDDMMATFNRGVLRSQTGDYRGAISDFTRVLNVYPNFLTGYYQRAEARRKIGDRKGAEEDEFVIMKAQLDQANSRVSGGGNKASSDKSEDGEESEGAKTRKQSDKNVENYNKLVIADDSELTRTYADDNRGRVQDRNVVIKLEGMFVLTYYEKPSELRRNSNFSRYIDELNHSKQLYRDLVITNAEAPLTEQQVNTHFALIDTHTADIVADSKNAVKRFARALDFYLVQDFSNAVDDLTQSILLDDTFFPAYFMRAVVRCKQMEYQRAENGASADQQSPSVAEQRNPVAGSSQPMGEDNLDYNVVRRDFDKVIELAPDFVYGYFNRGCLLASLNDYRAALRDFDKAIEIKPDFAEAYFNRGLTNIYLGNNKQGIADLSEAGELGIASAYNIIKRFSD